MNRHTWSIACVMTVALAATAFGQTSGSAATGTAAASGTSTVAGTGAAATDGQLSIKKQLRGELATLVVDMIQQLFRDIRTSVGLPAVATDPTSDPLAILESARRGVPVRPGTLS